MVKTLLAATATAAATAAAYFAYQYYKKHSSKPVALTKCDEYVCLPCAIDATFQSKPPPHVCSLAEALLQTRKMRRLVAHERHPLRVPQNR